MKRNDLSEQNQRLLDKWSGGSARLWEFQASHNRTIIRITQTGKHGNLHLICGDTDFISGPIVWNNCAFQIIETFYKNSYDMPVEYIIIDPLNRFEIHCGGFA